VRGDDSAFSWQDAEKDLMDGIDPTVAHAARTRNYLLGGKDNYHADRQLGDQILAILPDMATQARAARSFLARAVRHLAGPAGVRQFLDIGIGLPVLDNTHEVAQRAAPESRIVYVDNDPLVLAHARALLTGAPQGVTACIDADLRQPHRVSVAMAARGHPLGPAPPGGRLRRSRPQAVTRTSARTCRIWGSSPVAQTRGLNPSTGPGEPDAPPRPPRRAAHQSAATHPRHGQAPPP
jgi:hypothetical protein